MADSPNTTLYESARLSTTRRHAEDADLAGKQGSSYVDGEWEKPANTRGARAELGGRLDGIRQAPKDIRRKHCWGHLRAIPARQKSSTSQRPAGVTTLERTIFDHRNSLRVLGRGDTAQLGWDLKGLDTKVRGRRKLIVVLGARQAIIRV